jgi:acid phosphatase class B
MFSNFTMYFVGNHIEGEPPIYVGIHVDDIIYFSTIDAVEGKFESLLSTI